MASAAAPGPRPPRRKLPWAREAEAAGSWGLDEELPCSPPLPPPSAPPEGAPPAEEAPAGSAGGAGPEGAAAVGSSVSGPTQAEPDAWDSSLAKDSKKRPAVGDAEIPSAKRHAGESTASSLMPRADAERTPGGSTSQDQDLGTAKATDGEACWEFSVRDGFQPFDADCQHEVESQYKAFCGGVGRSLGRICSQGKTVLIDFERMKQHLEGSSRERHVRRRVTLPHGRGTATGSKAVVAASPATTHASPSAVAPTAGAIAALPVRAPSGGFAADSASPAPAMAAAPGIAAASSEELAGTKLVASTAPVPDSRSSKAKAALWEFGVRDGFKAFDVDCQESVEKQYQAFLVGGPGVGKTSTGGKVLFIDFALMKQHVEGSTRQRDVRRSTVLA